MGTATTEDHNHKNDDVYDIADNDSGDKSNDKTLHRRFADDSHMFLDSIVILYSN